MKIIIVGCGIGGLCAYHALKKHLSPESGLTFPSSDPLSITILESHLSASRTLGGGLGLAPNGQRAIASIYPPAIPYITARAFAGSEMTMRNSKGSLLGVVGAEMKKRYGYDMLMLPRHVVHEALLAGVPEEDVRWGVKVVSVKDSAGKVELRYQDGTTEEADLVIGADGVRSAVKNSLFNGRYEAVYDGLTGVGGFIPLSELPKTFQQGLRTNGVTMTFGRKGFFGYSMCSPLPSPEGSSNSGPENPAVEPFIQWWSIYECPTIPERREDIDYEDLKNQLITRHGDWRSPYDEPNAKEGDGESVFRRIIELGCRPPPPANAQEGATKKTPPRDTSAMVLPRYITPLLPSWSNAQIPSTPPENRGRVVLIGDAAHTMPPDVGQGVSCAAEDAVVYALLLKHFLLLQVSQRNSQNKDEAAESSRGSSKGSVAPTVFASTAKAYEDLRKPPILRLLKIAKYNGNAKKEMGAFGQMVRDLIMRIACKTNLFTSLNDAVFAYDGEVAVSEFLSALNSKEQSKKKDKSSQRL